MSALPKTIRWVGGLDGCVELIDQTLLPGELKLMHCHDIECVWEAIRKLRVRGAPAIGIAAAMGVVLGVRDAADEKTLFDQLGRQSDYLLTSRPTAVNLCWAVERMQACAERYRGKGVDVIKAALLEEGKAVRDEDAASCRAIGEFGASLIPQGGGVLTHCNAGSLATAEYGTALALMYVAHEQGRKFVVFSGETRPLMQGSRLTAWELSQAGIDVTTICDSAVASVMREGRINCVVTGADRIAANGDTANKIGTYAIALLARDHEIPFYIAAPASTFDLTCQNGAAIPIEQRDAAEVRAPMPAPEAARNITVYNPAFDVTPAHLIHAIITDRGVIRPVNEKEIAKTIKSQK